MATIQMNLVSQLFLRYLPSHVLKLKPLKTNGTGEVYTQDALSTTKSAVSSKDSNQSLASCLLQPQPDHCFLYAPQIQALCLTNVRIIKCLYACMYALKSKTASTISYIFRMIQHTHPFNDPLSRTTWLSRYQKGKTNLDITEARDSGISWAISKSAPRSR